jgi:hypothetical protein
VPHPAAVLAAAEFGAKRVRAAVPASAKQRLGLTRLARRRRQRSH